MPLNTDEPEVGLGVSLSYCLDLSATPKVYAEAITVTSISPDFQLGEAEYVPLSAVWKRFLPTLAEAECGFGIAYIPGDPAIKALRPLVFTPRVIGWRVMTQDGSKMDFPGYLKSFSPTWEAESVAEADCSIRITDTPVFTDPTS